MKMNSKLTKILVLAMAVVMLVAQAMPAMAASQTTVDINKFLILEKNANVPELTFNFEVEAASGDDLVQSGFPVTAGNMNGLKFGQTVASEGKLAASVSFSSASTTVTETPSGTGTPVPPTTTMDYTKNYYAYGAFTLDFSGVTFTEPGVYRYKITETSTSGNGVTVDSNTTRYLDVYVMWDATMANLEITGYVLTSTASAVPTNGTGAATPNTPNGSGGTQTNKSSGFENIYVTPDLTISKTVTGNQASKTKYFKFTVVFDTLPDGTYNVDLSAAESGAISNVGTNNAQFTIANGASQTVTYYLKGGQSLKFLDLPYGTKYTITEENGTYTASYTVDTGSGAGASTASNVCTETTNGITADTTVAFVNALNGTIPTGVLLTIAPFVGLMLIGLVGAVIVLKKKKDN